jgi:hypothetical protein
MRALDFIPAHIWGAYIVGETEANPRKTGFIQTSVANLSLDMIKRIETATPTGSVMATADKQPERS